MIGKTLINQWIIAAKGVLKEGFKWRFLSPLRRSLDRNILRAKFSPEQLRRMETHPKVALLYRDRRLPNFVNLDLNPSPFADYLCDLEQPPFPDCSIGELQISFVHCPPTEVFLERLLSSWRPKLIPGGRVEIHLSSDAPFEEIVACLERCGYVLDGSRPSGFFADAPSVVAFTKVPEPASAATSQLSGTREPNRRLKSYVREHFLSSMGTASLITVDASGRFRIRMEVPPENLYDSFFGSEPGEDDILCSMGEYLPLGDDSLTALCIDDVLSFIPSERMPDFFGDLFRVCLSEAHILIVVRGTPTRSTGLPDRFTKGNLAELLDRVGCEILRLDSLPFGEGDRRLIVLCKKKKAPDLYGRRVCALGSYRFTRYNQLGFHWDGQARAFDELGFQTLLLDPQATDDTVLTKQILEFQPEVILAGFSPCLDYLVRRMGSDLKPLKDAGCRVAYWFCDLRDPEPHDLREILDCMFLTNSGQISLYKQRYNLDRVYYLPQACTPSIMHRVDLPEAIPMGFAGSLTDPLHTDRTRFLHSLVDRYGLTATNTTRNDITDFYSRCKIVLSKGVGADIEHYTSNRFYVAIGCGAFVLCEKFKGIEDLVKNGEHLVWFESEKELEELVRHYIDRPEERTAIATNAQRLAHRKHTYTRRIRNLMDILDGRTDSFDGFLNS